MQLYIETSTSDTGAKTGRNPGRLAADFLDDFVLEIAYRGRRI